MSSTVRSTTASALAAVCLLVVAGCGDGDASSTGGGAAGEAVDGPTAQVVDAEEAVALLSDRDDLVVIDVRTPEELADGHLDDAVLLDLAGGQFEAEVGDLDRDAAYVLYCRSGNRSADAAAIMDELGFVEVYDAGGFADLAAAGAPTAD